METKPAVIERKNALQKLADRLDLSPIALEETLKKTAFAACTTNEQFVSAVMVANTYGLNPILREMSVFAGRQGQVVPVLMVDGWISLINRQSNYDGMELIENRPAASKNKSGTDVESVTCKIYLKDRSHPVVVTEYMDECYDETKQPWKRWPRRMLRHKALIQGARIAFGFSGIYDEDEKDRIIEAQGAVVETPIVGLKGAPAKPQETPRESTKVDAPLPVVNLDEDHAPALSQDAAAPFVPSSSSAETPIATIKAEIERMIADIAGDNKDEQRATLKAYSEFKTKSGRMASVMSVADDTLTDKWAILIHRKVKETWIERYGQEQDQEAVAAN